MRKTHIPQCQNCGTTLTHRYMVHLSGQFHICRACWINANARQKGIWRSIADRNEQKRHNHDQRRHGITP